MTAPLLDPRIHFSSQHERLEHVYKPWHWEAGWTGTLSSLGRMQTGWGRCPCALTPHHLLGSYLTRYTVWTELPKAQGRLDTSQQSHHIQVFDSAPAEATNYISSVEADTGSVVQAEAHGFNPCGLVHGLAVGKSLHFPYLL